MGNPDEAENSVEISANPLQGWINSFGENFKLSARWFRDFFRSFVAVFLNLIAKAPIRILRLGSHLLNGFVGAGTWLVVDSVKAVKKPAKRLKPLPKGEGLPEIETSQSVGQQLGNWFRRGWRSFLAWLGRLAAKIIDLFAIGELADLLTMVIKVNTRGLTDIEIEEARLVFGDSLDYWRVRLDEWSLIANVGKWVAERRQGKPVGHMAVTVFNTIHFSRRINTEPGNNDMAWLIHELVHIAQNEYVGSQFMGEALYAQGREGYDYGGPKAIKKRRFSSFNREQQGDIARDYYRSLHKKIDLEEDQNREYERLVAEMRAGNF
jgi:hypothetical protein